MNLIILVSSNVTNQYNLVNIFQAINVLQGHLNCLIPPAARHSTILNEFF